MAGRRCRSDSSASRPETRADLRDGPVAREDGRRRRLAVRSNRRRQSNDHGEQFDQYDSNHQHPDCHRIVIEPMPLLYRMRDTPPCSVNLTTYAHTCRTVSLCYSCASSCSTSPAICGGTGVARASYWTLKQCPSASQTLLSRTK